MVEHVQIVLHVRFFPDGTVMEIGRRPQGTTGQDWFTYLSQHTQNCYCALLGGRGIFRVTPAQLHTLTEAWQVKRPA